MRRRLLFLLMLSLPFFAQAQALRHTTVAELNARLAAGHDTTYVINFWATWCVPCLNELPHFETLQHRTQKTKVLLVNVDAAARYNKVLAFVKKRRLQAEVLFLDEPNEQRFIDRIDSTWSGALPATLFVNGTKRRFYEAAFTFPELLKAYKNFTP